MPFMIGNAPIRRTLNYLKDCKIIFRENVRIFSISYLQQKQHSLGASEFVFWHLPQVQFNNPTVQCIKLLNLTPTPFIKVYREDDEPVLIDLDCRSREEIMNHLKNLHIITKTSEEIAEDEKKVKVHTNPAYFGSGCERHCMCEIPGQILCPVIGKLPKHWKGIPSKTPKVFIPPFIEKWGKEMQNEPTVMEKSQENNVSIS